MIKTQNYKIQSVIKIVNMDIMIIKCINSIYMPQCQGKCLNGRRCHRNQHSNHRRYCWQHQRGGNNEIKTYSHVLYQKPIQNLKSIINGGKLQPFAIRIYDISNDELQRTIDTNLLRLDEIHKNPLVYGVVNQGTLRGQVNWLWHGKPKKRFGDVTFIFELPIKRRKLYYRKLDKSFYVFYKSLTQAHNETKSRLNKIPIGQTEVNNIYEIGANVSVTPVPINLEHLKAIVITITNRLGTKNETGHKILADIPFLNQIRTKYPNVKIVAYSIKTQKLANVTPWVDEQIKYKL